MGPHDRRTALVTLSALFLSACGGGASTPEPDAVTGSALPPAQDIIPPPPPPSPPPPAAVPDPDPVVSPPSRGAAKTGLYVQGSKLRNRFGVELRLRAVEVMVDDNVSRYGYARFLQQIKDDLGANAVSPLFRGEYGSVAEVKKFCDAALALKMVVGVNGDHQGDGREWLMATSMVTLLNNYPHVYLVCEVETYSDGSPTNAEWVASERNKINALRAAGHTSPIKAGTYAGGRDVQYPLAAGAQLLQADPLKNVIFTWQAYWKEATEGWQFSEENGFTAGAAGAKAALTACSSSGLCFLPGFDFRDDVGLTGEADLIEHAGALGMSHAHWVAVGDSAYAENNLYGSDLNPNPPKAVASMLSSKWMALRSQFSDATSL